jgi:hypothetical protein
MGCALYNTPVFMGKAKVTISGEQQLFTSPLTPSPKVRRDKKQQTIFKHRWLPIQEPQFLETMNSYTLYNESIKTFLRAANANNYCATACSKSYAETMAECIRLNMECAAICYNAAQLMGTSSNKLKEICSICAYMCEQCAAECSKYDNAYCNACAEASRACLYECRKLTMGVAA